MVIAATSRSMVPETTGVTIRRSRGSHADRRKCASEETMTRLASSAGPPWANAIRETGI